MPSTEKLIIGASSVQSLSQFIGECANCVMYFERNITLGRLGAVRELISELLKRCFRPLCNGWQAMALLITAK